jgi:serine/threonine protein kinase
VSKIFGERYEVLEQIGAGGMAIVYKAKDLLLNRVVTIKVLREQFATDEDFIRRFRREAQSAASLSHPNIVSIYDTGKDGDTEYIVMEYVEGRNLKEIIRDYAPLSIDQALNLGCQITVAIQNAHEHHIIHRDIKPHNILVTADGHAKVTDFGIARAVSSATVTHTGDIVGSVHYLSPEQAKGMQSNEQSDIYSLGIVLYELLTGKVPYDGETPITIALKHLQEQPVSPSKINPRVDQEFEAVIMRAIAKSPEQRYTSAIELLTDLNHLQAGEPITRGAIPFTDDTEATQIHKGMSKNLAPIKITDPSVEDKPSSAKMENKRRRLWMVSGFVFLFLLLSLAGGLAFKSFLFVKETTVPNVIGKTVSEAEISMQQAKLSLDPVAYEFSDTFEKDYIINQDPKADTTVKEGKQVRVIVSKGVETAKFPDVTTGLVSKEDAEILIHNAGFTGKIFFDSRHSDTVPKGYVMAQSVMPNASWAKSGPITLTISEGPLLKQINMPNVIGQTSSEAKKMLEENNKLIVHIENENSSTFPIDVVMRTTPNPGEAVLQGTEVTMYVCSGPGPLAYGYSNKIKKLIVNYFNKVVINEEYL